MSVTSTSNHRDQSSRTAWASGIVVFAGTVLATLGLFQFFEGLSAVLDDQVYVSTREYVYQFDISTWGWIHLVLGLAAVGVGVALLVGQAWALVVGILIAAFSAISQFLFLPWYPVWAVTIIAFDVAVMWALSVRLGERDHG